MIMDDEVQPVNCAGGNVPDILVEFDDYLVAVEVTLSSGRRQYATETEPVTFHVGRCQHEEAMTGRKRKVYGLFIAPQINIHAANHYMQHIKILEVPGFGHVTVIPFELETWLDVLSFANSIGSLRTHALGRLLGSLENSAKDSSNVEKWLTSFHSSIEEWKSHIHN